MSSRNAYLTEAERGQAAALPAAMRKAIAELEAGGSADPVLDRLRANLLLGGFASVDYAELCDAQTLEPLRQVGTVARQAAGGRRGSARPG